MSGRPTPGEDWFDAAYASIPGAPSVEELQRVSMEALGERLAADLNERIDEMIAAMPWPARKAMTLYRRWIRWRLRGQR